MSWAAWWKADLRRQFDEWYRIAPKNDAIEKRPIQRRKS